MRAREPRLSARVVTILCSSSRSVRTVLTVSQVVGWRPAPRNHATPRVEHTGAQALPHTRSLTDINTTLLSGLVARHITRDHDTSRDGLLIGWGSSGVMQRTSHFVGKESSGERCMDVRQAQGKADPWAFAVGDTIRNDPKCLVGIQGLCR